MTPTEAPCPKREVPPRAPAPITARTASAEQTMSLARALAGVLRSGDVLLLAGDLGAGKTTFTKGLAAALGVMDPVTSPTFTLVRTYPTSATADGPPHTGRVTSIVHADLFRLDHLREVVDLAIGEMLEDGEEEGEEGEGGSVAVVEWGDLAAPVLGRDALVVSLLQGSAPDERLVRLELSACWESRREEIEERLGPWR